MALNWDDFLDSECYDLSHAQWLATQSSEISGYASQMANSIPTNSSEFIAAHPPQLTPLPRTSQGTSDPEDLSSMSNFLFQRDLEILRALEASHSSPDCITDINKHTVSSAATSPSAPGQPILNAPEFSTTGSKPTFSDGMDLDFSKDLAFLERTPQISTRDLDRLLNPTSTTSKRQKNIPDIMSACWTSPLCPNNGQTGSPPNPSTCSAACSPFLLATEEILPSPSLSNILIQPQEVINEEEILEPQVRHRKRSESTASLDDDRGRQTQPEDISVSPPDITSIRSTRQMRRAHSRQSTLTIDTKAKAPKFSRRLPHNQVERKYRESLNSQLDNLRRAVPSLQQTPPPCENADIEDISTPSKPSKAVILASATAYIKQIEEEKKMLVAENLLLRRRIKTPQAAVKCEDCSLMQYVSNLNLGQAK